MNILQMAILAQGQPKPSGGGEILWIGMGLAIVAYIVMMSMGARKDRKKRDNMLAAIERNDRVMTIGGIIGSVVSVTDADVTLKVDESANVKITVIRSAIQKVLTEGEKPEALRAN